MFKLLEKRKSKKLMILCIPIALAAIYLGGFINCEYDMQGVLLIIALYFARKKPWQSIVIIVWSVALYIIWYAATAASLSLSPILDCIFSILACVPICLYNGKRGLPLKWTFYAYYPAHILLLTILKHAIT